MTRLAGWSAPSRARGQCDSPPSVQVRAKRPAKVASPPTTPAIGPTASEMSKPAVAPTIAWCTRGTVLGGQDGHRHLEWPYPRRCVLPIIGSGWLFGALYASQQAGAAALIAWGVGAVFMLTLALIHAELGGAYPVAGGTARFPHYSHGSMTGYAIGWLWWLGAVTVAPIEVEAALQYFTHYLSWLTTTSGGETVLTAQGYGAAVLLMALFTFVNIMGVRWLAKANTPITAWKIAIAASAGSPFSSISTLRSRPAAPGCSTRARARASHTRSVGTAGGLTGSADSPGAGSRSLRHS